MKKYFTRFAIILFAIIFISPSAYRKHTLKEKEKSSSEPRSESWAALQFLNNSRAYPYKDIPADGYRKAELFYKHISKTKRQEQVMSGRQLGKVSVPIILAEELWLLPLIQLTLQLFGWVPHQAVCGNQQPEVLD